MSALLAATGVVPVAAQDSGSLPPPWVIGQVAVSGTKNVKPSVVLSQVKARKGDLYDQSDLDQDIQNLLGLGDFNGVQADVTSLGAPVPDYLRRVAGSTATVKLTFIVSEKPVIERIDFKNNFKLSRGALADAISLKKGDPLDLVKLEDDKEKILEKYNKKGFLDATVESQIATDTGTMKSVLTFKVNEGAKSQIFWVSIRGVHAFKPKKILGLMKNRRGKVYAEKDLPEDIHAIQAYYRHRGYLDVVVSSPTVMVSWDKTRLYISLSIQEGRSYRFGKTSFVGNLVYTNAQLAKAVTYHAGKTFDDDKYQETIRNIQELYADKGYLHLQVNPVRTLDPKTGCLNVQFNLIEGDVVYVDNVDVSGNVETKTYVLKREILVKPGEPFNAKKVRRSREALMNLGFLDDVGVNLDSPGNPDLVDLDFNVKEGKPGMLTAGAAYSTIDGLFGTLSLQNMNLFGRAQHVGVQWSFGSRVRNYSLSWSEPWVGNHPWTLGATLFDTMQLSPFGSDLTAYTQESKGGSIFLAPRFADNLYQLKFTYTFSRTSISGIDPALPANSILTPGTSNFSAVSVEFARDSRDNIYDPTSGSRNSVSLQLAGGPLGGDINFLEPGLSDSVNYKLFSIDDYPFVLTLGNRGAYIGQFGATAHVPVYDLFFLGAPDTMRGYEPTGQVGNPNGGYIYDTATAEFGFPVAREGERTIAKIVSFFDIGSTWTNFDQVSMKVGSQDTELKTDVGIGIRLTTPAFPIRLEWGYGFNHAPGEKIYQISFGMANLF
ncbi:MAG TPA: outer membrane protein assembly factor BamA [Elusimicrobiota bacterium]|nr:outer membrane protein assembly factor BamA [Elusimicrobiota bacterium]